MLSVNRFASSARAAEYVADYWYLHSEAPGPVEIGIFPDSYFSLIFDINHPENSFIAGTMNCSLKNIINPHSRLFGVQIKPFLIPFLLGTSAESFVNGSTPAVFTKNIVHRICDRLRKCRSQHEMSETVESVLLPLFENLRAERGVFRKISEAMLNGTAPPTVRETAFHAGISEKQLERYFLKHTGLAVKEYSLLTAFERSCRMLEIGAASVSCAHSLEFYDQSHFIRNFRRFSGITPTEYASLKNVGFIQYSIGFIQYSI
jgi:AraC-like DNA-binding protein